jgi:hypothetical protein
MGTAGTEVGVHETRKKTRRKAERKMNFMQGILSDLSPSLRGGLLVETQAVETQPDEAISYIISEIASLPLRGASQ